MDSTTTSSSNLRVTQSTPSFLLSTRGHRQHPNLLPQFKGDTEHPNLPPQTGGQRPLPAGFGAVGPHPARPRVPPARGLRWLPPAQGSSRPGAAGSSPEGGGRSGAVSKAAPARSCGGSRPGSGDRGPSAHVRPPGTCSLSAAHEQRRRGAIGHLGPPRTERAAPPVPGREQPPPPRRPARPPWRRLPAPPALPPGCSEHPSAPLAFVLILLRDKMATPAAVNPPGE